jgi:hypothetical protein
MTRLVSGALVCIAGATGLVIFLPMIVNGGAMEFREPNLFIRWGEFVFCMASMVLGFIGLKGEK